MINIVPCLLSLTSLVELDPPLQPVALDSEGSFAMGGRCRGWAWGLLAGPIREYSGRIIVRSGRNPP